MMGRAIQVAIWLIVTALLVGLPAAHMLHFQNVDLHGEIVRSEPVPHGSRYLVRERSGQLQGVYSGGSDGGFPSELSVGTVVEKDRGSLDFKLDGRPQTTDVVSWLEILAGWMLLSIAAVWWKTALAKRRRKSR
jgi:hypothetical protein